MWQWQYTLARPEKGNVAQDEVGKKRLDGKENEDNRLSCHRNAGDLRDWAQSGGWLESASEA